jgi:hypothetical protein
VRLAEKLGWSEEERADKLYPETPADALGQFLGGAAVPRPLNLERARDMAREERLARMSPARRARTRVLEEREKMVAEAQRVGLLGENAKLGPPLQNAWRLQARRAAAYADAGTGKLAHKPYQLAAFAVDVKLLVSIGAWSEQEARAALAEAQRMGEEELQQWRQNINLKLFGGGLLAQIKREIREAGGYS